MLSCSSLHLFPKSLFAIDAVFVVSTVLGVPEVYCTRDDTVPATKTYLEATNNATNLHVCQQDTKSRKQVSPSKQPRTPITTDVHVHSSSTIDQDALCLLSATRRSHIFGKLLHFGKEFGRFALGKAKEGKERTQ